MIGAALARDAKEVPRTGAIIDAERNNLVLIGIQNPREALSRIHALVREAKQDLKCGKGTDAFVKLNKIQDLAGGPV